MKRTIIAVFGIILVVGLLLWLVPWLANGGWPSSGPVGGALPPQIQHVMPGDGEVVVEAYGFCVHYNYQAGRGMDDESQESARYFFDGRNVTKQVYDLISLEYPTQVGEPCYQGDEPLKPGWHTVKVTYEDNSGQRHEYKWRFQTTNEE